MDFLKQIPSLIIDIEKAVPESGQGKTKLALLIEILRPLVPDVDKYITIITAVANLTVKIYNLIGLFKK